MKKLFATIGIMALAVSAFSQFISGPDIRSAWSYATPFKINMTGLALPGTTNIPSDAMIPFRVKGNTVKVYSDLATTNALQSNVVFRFQFSIDGSKWFGVPATTVTGESATRSIQFSPLAAGQGYLLTNVLSSTEAPGMNWVRLHSISNSGYLGGDLSNAVWITNIYFISPQ